MKFIKKIEIIHLLSFIGVKEGLTASIPSIWRNFFAYILIEKEES